MAETPFDNTKQLDEEHEKLAGWWGSLKASALPKGLKSTAGGAAGVSWSALEPSLEQQSRERRFATSHRPGSNVAPNG
jgi:hypothetical protein